MYFFGVKAHIGVYAESGLVHSLVHTAANVSDVTQIDQLLHGEETYVSGDAGYTGVDNHKMIWSIATRLSMYKKHRKQSFIAQVRRIRKGPDVNQWRTSVPGNQARVWLYGSALSWFV